MPGSGAMARTVMAGAMSAFSMVLPVVKRSQAGGSHQHSSPATRASRRTRRHRQLCRSQCSRRMDSSGPDRARQSSSPSWSAGGFR